MSKQKVTITDNSIKSGVTSDVKKAICEFIWNGFDANAINVKLTYSCNELGFISSLAIKDDGEGISRKMLDSTFGKYQDSIKSKSYQWSSQVKRHKGKGRYAFNCFATKADWITIYKEGDYLLKHHISIDSGDNDHFNDHSDEDKIVHNVPTGTEVKFTNITINKAFFESDDFIEYLKKEYAVFLKLNESSGKSISINGNILEYRSIIADTDSTNFNIADEDDGERAYKFHLTFIRWKEKIKENYSSYFLDENQMEHFERTTTLNKKDTGFHHSVYIISEYFNDFKPLIKKTGKVGDIDLNIQEQEQVLFPEFKGNKTEKDKVFKQLLKEVTAWIVEKEKDYISNIAGDELWTKFEKNGTVIRPNNEYEIPLFEDLKQTVKGIYSVQPKVFTNIKREQAKTLVGCLNLLLQTDKREDLITIIASVVKMTDEERHRLVDILQVTELSHITNTIALLENRLKTISAIKAMIYDKTLNAYEVPDIQKMISSAFWLFGEQYNIVTEAEPDFQQALESYLEKIHEGNKGVGKSMLSVEKLKHPDRNKEMDIFALRQTKDSKKIENIIVELKRPNVKLGELEVSQIKTYMRLIYQEPQFNSTNAKWTFILVGNELDKSSTIENEYESNKTWGKKDLIMNVNNANQNYEIYIKTWSTIFEDFEMRHDFLLQKLECKRELLSAKYKNKDDLHNIVNSAEEK